MTVIGDGIIGALRQGAQGFGDTQRRQIRQQEIDKNEAVFDQLDAVSLVSELDGRGNYIQRMQGGSDGPIASLDMERLASEQPDLALQILNDDPRYNSYTDERGREIQTKITRLIKNPDGSYSAAVVREDGREVPLTQGRSTNGDDTIVTIDGETLNRIGTNRVVDAIGRDGMNNANSFMRLGGMVNAEMLKAGLIRQTVLDTGAEMGLDPSGKAQLYAMINSADNEDLEIMAREFGLDPDMLGEEADRMMADIKVEGLDEVGADNSEALQQVETLEAAIESINTELTSINEAGDFSDVVMARIDELVGERNDLKSNLVDIATDRPDAPSRPPGEVRSDYADLSLQSAPEGRAPEFVKRADTIRKALIDGLEEPTEEQTEKARQYLEANSVTDAQDISKLPTEEAMNVAWIMAASQPGTTAQRLEVFNAVAGMIKHGTDGAPDTGDAISAARLNRDINKDAADDLETRRSAAIEMEDRVIPLETEIERLTSQGSEGNIGIEGEEDREAVISNLREMSRLFNSPNRFPEERLAAARPLMNGMGRYIAAEVQSDNPAFWKVGQHLARWIRRDGRAPTGGEIMRQIRITEKNGRPNQIIFLDPDGTPTEAVLDWNEIGDRFSAEFSRTFLSAYSEYRNAVDQEE